MASILSPLPPSLQRLHALSDAEAASEAPVHECYTELDHEELQAIQLMVDMSSPDVRRRVKSVQRFSRFEDEQLFFEAVSAARGVIRGVDRTIEFKNLWKCTAHLHEVLMWRAHSPTELAAMPIVPNEPRRLSWVRESLFRLEFFARNTKGPREGVYLSTLLWRGPDDERDGLRRMCHVPDDATEALIVRAFVGNCHKGRTGLDSTHHSCTSRRDELVVLNSSHLMPAYLVQFEVAA